MKINKELLKSIVRLAADGAHYNEMYDAEDELLFMYERLQHEPVQLSNASGTGYSIPEKLETYRTLMTECLINMNCDNCRKRRTCRKFKRMTDYLPIQFVDIPVDLDEVIND